MFQLLQLKFSEDDTFEITQYFGVIYHSMFSYKCELKTTATNKQTKTPPLWISGLSASLSRQSILPMGWRWRTETSRCGIPSIVFAVEGKVSCNLILKKLHLWEMHHHGEKKPQTLHSFFSSLCCSMKNSIMFYQTCYVLNASLWTEQTEIFLVEQAQTTIVYLLNVKQVFFILKNPWFPSC